MKHHKSTVLERILESVNIFETVRSNRYMQPDVVPSLRNTGTHTSCTITYIGRENVKLIENCIGIYVSSNSLIWYFSIIIFN